MDTPPVRRRFVVVAIMVAAVSLALIVVGIYGLILGPHPTESSDPGQPGSSESARPFASTSRAKLPTVTDSTDPVAYARQVAQALFAWDTRSGIPRSDYLNVLLAESVPQSEEANGLVADLVGYYPTDEQWRRLLGYEARQTLTITDATIPASWPHIQQEYPEQISAEVTAVTIRGERHRAGTWAGSPTETTHEVAFTIFVFCAADADSCQLVRLSGLGTPLE